MPPLYAFNSFFFSRTGYEWDDVAVSLPYVSEKKPARVLFGILASVYARTLSCKLNCYINDY
jgi:hypothetical protein